MSSIEQGLAAGHANQTEMPAEIVQEIRGSYEDKKVLAIFDKLITNFKKTVETSTGVWFNQNNLIMLLIAFANSTFRESCNDELRFLNIINATIKAANIKTIIKDNEMAIEISSKPYNFLLQSAKIEYNDDYDRDQYLALHNESLNAFGTAIDKTVKVADGLYVDKVIQVPHLIWDQNDAEKHPMGEAFTVSLQDLQDKGMFDEDKLKELVAQVSISAGEDFDSSNAKIQLYEIHGQLPADIFKSGAKGLEQGMFIVAETDWHDRIVLYKGREDFHPYTINRKEVVFNRSLGRGIGEEMIHSQITSNEVFNLTLDQLRSSKIFYQTSDTELDGQSLLEIDNMTILSHEDESPITQVSAAPLAFGALSSFQEFNMSAARQNASVQDFALGIGPKSNVSFAALQSAGKEADSQYAYAKDKNMSYFRKQMKRKKVGYIASLVSYFESGKDIEELLTPYKLLAFKKFIAKKKAEAIIAKQVKDGFLYIDEVDEVSEFILNDIKGQKHSIKIDEKIDIDFVVDKTRIALGGEQSQIKRDIELLNVKLENVLRNPEAFPSSNAESIQNEMAELTNLASASSGDGTSQISITPTGPDVAANAGLINSNGL